MLCPQKKKAANRAAEKERLATESGLSAGLNPWERALSLVTDPKGGKTTNYVLDNCLKTQFL